ncbi:hypothetical protein [Anaerotignum sp.]|uniref:hypothetical protein n=1 Tax=Anaerotignum sp. TaxID=2039241 RepID=UPI0028AEEFEC|nr:hypothetical protein [Anaerotignum sp.]
MTNQNVKYYILGIGIDSYSMEDNREFNPTAQSWSKTPPSSWRAIAVDGAQSILSENYEVTLKRGSTWKVDLNVNC